MQARIKAARAAARFGQTLALNRLALTATDVLAGLETRANFDPNQPREPRGRPTGGQWVAYGARELGTAARQVRAAIGRASGEVQAFLIMNEESVTRFLGLVQAAGGAAEAGSGAAVVAGGAETPLAPVTTVLGSWMVRNGYDNFDTGLRVLLTGEHHETNLKPRPARLGPERARRGAHRDAAERRDDLRGPSRRPRRPQPGSPGQPVPTGAGGLLGQCAERPFGQPGDLGRAQHSDDGRGVGGL